MKQKNASIGTTMTWVVATIIIFIVIIIFVYAAGVMAVTRNPFRAGASESSVLGLRSMQTQQMLMAVLESNLDKSKVKDYLINGDYDVLKPKLGDLLMKIPGGNYNDLGTGIYICRWGIEVFQGGIIKMQAGDSIKGEANPSAVYLSDRRILFNFARKFVIKYTNMPKV